MIKQVSLIRIEIALTSHYDGIEKSFQQMLQLNLTLSCIMLENGQTTV